MSNIKNELKLMTLSEDKKEPSISEIYQIITIKVDKILEKFSNKQLKKNAS